MVEGHDNDTSTQGTTMTTSNQAYTMAFALPKRANCYGEWVVRAYKNGKRHAAVDYYADSKADAVATHLAMTQHEATRRASLGQYDPYNV